MQGERWGIQGTSWLQILCRVPGIHVGRDLSWSSRRPQSFCLLTSPSHSQEGRGGGGGGGPWEGLVLAAPVRCVSKGREGVLCFPFLLSMSKQPTPLWALQLAACHTLSSYLSLGDGGGSPMRRGRKTEPPHILTPYKAQTQRVKPRVPAGTDAGSPGHIPQLLRHEVLL